MEVKRFRADWRHVVETEFDDAQYVGVKDFDRILAERDALQQLLNARDEEVGKLRNLLVATKGHVEFSVDYWASNEKSDFGLIESIRTMENQA